MPQILRKLETRSCMPIVSCFLHLFLGSITRKIAGSEDLIIAGVSSRKLWYGCTQLFLRDDVVIYFKNSQILILLLCALSFSCSNCCLISHSMFSSYTHSAFITRCETRTVCNLLNIKFVRVSTDGNTDWNGKKKKKTGINRRQSNYIGVIRYTFIRLYVEVLFQW